MVDLEYAVFAGGCFWCLEDYFANFKGVVSVKSGYSGGLLVDPSYEMVCMGNTGHLECVRVGFDPNLCTYRHLVIAYCMQIDPTQQDGQFLDRGAAYTTAIFYANNQQKVISEDILAQVSGMFDRVYTVVRPLDRFYEAEPRHQNYAEKNKKHYQLYKRFSGRSEVLKRLWAGKKLK